MERRRQVYYVGLERRIIGQLCVSRWEADDEEIVAAAAEREL